MLLLTLHLFAFTYTVSGNVRLLWFNNPRFAVQLLLVLSLAVHILSNIKPLLISLGSGSIKPRVLDILVVLSVLLLFMAFGFVIYYLRWNVW